MIQKGSLRESKLDLSLTPSAYPVDVFNRLIKPLHQAATPDRYQIATPDRYTKSLLQAAAPNRYTKISPY